MSQSEHLFELAQRFIPGGVNSPVRAFGGVDSEPVFIKSGHGPYIVDVDNKEYIDYVCSWGPLIVGHAHPYVLEKVSEAVKNGFSFGASTAIEIELAQKVCQFMPSIELVRCVNSGTEAAMSAIRVARGYTKRDKIIKFIGCYHGHTDSLLVAAGSGGLTFGIPSSAGVPKSTTEQTLLAEFNNLEQVAVLFAEYPNEIAAIIVEPIPANMNLVLPKPEFLSGLRLLCDRYGSVLIFDEVITGFRVGLGGAQTHYKITPDLTILGKIIGGGFPTAAFGGRKEIMRELAPLGPVYQAGTLSGNPIAMAAGLATLELISVENFYEKLHDKTQILIQGLNQLAAVYHIPFHAIGLGGMFGLFFTEIKKIENENDVKKCNIHLFKQFFHGMLKEGIYLAPSAFEIGFLSAAHGDKEIDKTLSAADKVFQQIRDLCESLQVAQA